MSTPEHGGQEPDPHRSLVDELARDPYLQHVMGHVMREEPVDHPVKDWHMEMRRHIQDKFGIQAGDTVIIPKIFLECANILCEEEIERGEA